MRKIIIFITTAVYIAAESEETGWKLLRCNTTETGYQTCLQFRFQGKFLFEPEFGVRICHMRKVLYCRILPLSQNGFDAYFYLNNV